MAFSLIWLSILKSELYVSISFLIFWNSSKIFNCYPSNSLYFGKKILVYLWFSSSTSFNLSLRFCIKLRDPFEFAMSSLISLSFLLRVNSVSSITCWSLRISSNSLDLLVSFNSFSYCYNLRFSPTKISIYERRLLTYFWLQVT